MVIDIGDEQPAHRVDRVRHEGPVVIGTRHREDRGVIRHGSDAKLVKLAPDVAEVDHRLVDAPGDDAGGDAARERHREPCREGIFRFCVLAAYPDLADLRKGHDRHQHEAGHDRDLIEPPKAVERPGKDHAAGLGQHVLVDDAYNSRRRDDDVGGNKYFPTHRFLHVHRSFSGIHKNNLPICFYNEGPEGPLITFFQPPPRSSPASAAVP